VQIRGGVHVMCLHKVHWRDAALTLPRDMQATAAPPHTHGGEVPGLDPLIPRYCSVLFSVFRFCCSWCSSSRIVCCHNPLAREVNGGLELRLKQPRLRAQYPRNTHQVHSSQPQWGV
jgi:hypothetical protein